MTAPRWIAEEVERLNESADACLAEAKRCARVCIALRMIEFVARFALFVAVYLHSPFAVVVLASGIAMALLRRRHERALDNAIRGSWLRTGHMQGLVQSFQRRPSVIARVPFDRVHTEAPN